MKRILPMFALLLFTAACNDMGKEPSTLSAPQVVGARAVPYTVTPGTTITLEAITHGVDTLEWYACFAPYIPDGDPRCATEPDFAELALGSGESVNLQIPEAATFETFGVNVPGVYVRLVATGESKTQTAVATIPFDLPGAHPTITALLDESGGPVGDSVPVGTELTLKPELELPEGAGDVLVTWFVEGGEADPYRTKNDGVVTITPPEEPGPMRVIAVVRDGSFGVGWFDATFTVTDP